MPLTWNEIKDRAFAFSREWAGEAAERAEAQSFWNDFFDVFGVKRRRVATFEKWVAKLPDHAKKRSGRIDAFWPGTLLIEHKSLGSDLTAAFGQAADYFHGLKDAELPRYVVVSDFARFRIYDLDENTDHEFALAELHQNIQLFGFIAGYQKQKIREQDPINIKAVQQMGLLHDALKRDGYQGHPLEMFLVRLMFCLFADDTGIFETKDAFQDLIETWTAEDGHDVGEVLNTLFATLNKKPEDRQKSLAEQYESFPYVNGRLFEDRIEPPSFNSAMREMLLELCGLHWGAISPAIFGAMFQHVIELDERDRRRQLGAHYTSEENIFKLIKPLFLDELWEEFECIKGNKNKLFEFHKKLSRLTFLDPACGCGNFLVITYRELRKLELEVLRAAQSHGHAIGEVFRALQVDVDQFYGIECEEFPAQVAQVAMWLVDHQMNVKAGEEFGGYFARIPLLKGAHIRHGNALRIDWEELVPPMRLNYILGNPPFVGKKEQTKDQKQDLEFVTKGIKGAGVLDYVAGWYLKSAQLITGTKEGFVSRDKHHYAEVTIAGQAINPPPIALAKRGGGRASKRSNLAIDDLFVSAERVDQEARKRIRCAFVSTKSIIQGEQVGVLWGELLRRRIKIHFAHRTFKWSNEAPGMAAVHCVIIGFAASDVDAKQIFEYLDVKGKPHAVNALNINPYLIDAPDIVLSRRSVPIGDTARITYGSMALDDGHLTLSDQEREEFIQTQPACQKYIQKFIGGEEFINNGSRWCLWLPRIEPLELKRLAPILERVERVRVYRKTSGRAATVKLANTPTLFGENRQPTSDYILIPKVSSENRRFLPIGFCRADVIASGSCLIVPDANLYHFGVLSCSMHMAWMRYTCGRLEDRYQYSTTIVYNNFPWPSDPPETQKQKIESAAQSVLDARAQFSDASLADLYDPLTMPPALSAAHQKLDATVDAAYGRKEFKNDAERVAFLFTLYQMYTSFLPV